MNSKKKSTHDDTVDVDTSKPNNISTKKIPGKNKIYDYKLLEALKFDAREKLKLTELNIKAVNTTLENELRIRQKLLKVRRRLMQRESFFKYKIYYMNKEIKNLIFGKSPENSTSRSVSKSRRIIQTNKKYIIRSKSTNKCRRINKYAE